MMQTLMELGRMLLGLAALAGFCCWLCRDRRSIDWRLAGAGLALQFVLALLALKVPPAGQALESVTRFFIKILEFSETGAGFVFGDLAKNHATYGATIAFKVLPTIVFFAAFTSVLYYAGILQKLVYAMAWLMNKTMRLSGAESLAAAANIFVGMTQAPLMVKPFIERMTRSEILCLMTGGMATIAGGVFMAYMGFLGGGDAARQLLFGKHLMTASILSAPAAIVCAKLILPETREIDREMKISGQKFGVNIFDAMMNGAAQGVKLAVNVGAALLVFMAAIAMVNYICEDGLGRLTGLNGLIARATGGAYEGLTLQFMLGAVFAPVAWLIGADTESALYVGQLLGEKVVLNEFVAYIDFSAMMKEGIITDDKTIVVTTYALCGFANFGSLGILIGGISVLAPNQRASLARLALPSLAGGMAACLMTACIAGFLAG